MATKLPLQLNNIRFTVNPTHLLITKGVNFGTLNTQGGVKYHIWYDTPEILTINGVAAGKSAYTELLFLKQHFERTDKKSELFYKTRVYKGFITNLTIEHSTSHINEFTYSITFQLLFGEKFAVEDFSIKSDEKEVVRGAIGEISKFINEKIKGFERSVEKRLNRI